MRARPAATTRAAAHEAGRPPRADFHLLNLMVFLTLFVVGYMLVGLADSYITLLIHFFVCLIFTGMKNLAVSMADPFGDDVIDFRIEKFLSGMYEHALAHCHHEFHPNRSQIPEGIHNPLAISPSKRSYATPVKKGASGKLQMVKNAKEKMSNIAKNTKEKIANAVACRPP